MKLNDMIWITLLGACVGCASPAPGRTGARHDTVASTERSAPGHALASSDSTSVEAAAAVLREYYSAIDARDYRRAYRLWEGEGAASGKSFQRFAAGFAGTARVAVTVGGAGAIEGATGSRYVAIPVALHAVMRQGGEQNYQGSYVLRRNVVDGATQAQRHWHIYSATIKRLPR